MTGSRTRLRTSRVLASDDAAGQRELALRDPEPFCRAIYPRLVGALSLSHGDHFVAEELAQETLTRVLERWARIRELADPEGYTFRMAFNLGHSWWRRAGTERRARQRAGHRHEVHDADDAMRLAVRAAVAGLAPRQREALVYRFYLGCDVHETAAAMRCAEGTVKALTSQAIDALRRLGLRIDDV